MFCVLRKKEITLNTVNIQEILIVNSIGVILMAFLQYVRYKKNEKKKYGEPIFDVMIWTAVAGCILESVSFVIDGRVFPGCILLSYISNSLCFIGTSGVGFLWCLYTEIRIFRSLQRLKNKIIYLAAPFIVEIILVIINLAGTGVLFSVSQDNVYERGFLVSYSYIILFFYYICSICMVDRSRRSGLYVHQYPTLLFIIPCVVGTVAQGVFYGVSVGWTSVAMAMLFVYIQLQSLDLLTDPLSGLYNRKHLEATFMSIAKNSRIRKIYGIMLDVNGFKQINDTYGHNEGDNAIRHIGRILSNSVSDSGIVIRFAGDEFIVLMNTESEDEVRAVIDRIELNVGAFNMSGRVPYNISFAIGYEGVDSSQTMEDFISCLDEQMYHAKKKYYAGTGTDRRRSEAL